MRWLRRRLGGDTPVSEVPPMPPVTSLHEATAARTESESTLAAVYDRDATVQSLSASLRRARKRNHFSDLIIEALGTHRP